LTCEAFGGTLGFGVAFPPLIRSMRWSPFCVPYKSSASLYSAYTNFHTFSASTSHPLPNLALNAANFPASSSSTLSNFCELGFHSGAFRMSLALLYTGCGFVVRSVKELPSERVMSCVNVYGRFGLLRSVACRTWFVWCIWGWIDCRKTRRALIEGIGEAMGGCGEAVETMGEALGRGGVVAGWPKLRS
jgi:hypothetical protein